MATLPADLPENWSQGQIVSPNGIEVKLSEKHGYNYLMKQVNNTQKAVNDLTENMANIISIKNSTAKAYLQYDPDDGCIHVIEA